MLKPIKYPYFYGVKKVLLLLFIPVFMLNNSLGELFKLPVLAAHFEEHRSQNPEIGFTDFLAMHYGGDDHNDKDQDRDEQLPFKKITESHDFQAIFLPDRIIDEPVRGFTATNVKLPLPQDENLSDPALDGLFRPPRLG